MVRVSESTGKAVIAFGFNPIVTGLMSTAVVFGGHYLSLWTRVNPLAAGVVAAAQTILATGIISKIPHIPIINKEVIHVVAHFGSNRLVGIITSVMGLFKYFPAAFAFSGGLPLMLAMCALSYGSIHLGDYLFSQMQEAKWIEPPITVVKQNDPNSPAVNQNNPYRNTTSSTVVNQFNPII